MQWCDRYANDEAGPEFAEAIKWCLRIPTIRSGGGEQCTIATRSFETSVAVAIELVGAFSVVWRMNLKTTSTSVICDAHFPPKFYEKIRLRDCQMWTVPVDPPLVNDEVRW